MNVAGTAINIHQMIPIRKSLPFPRTRLDTNAPSIAATFKLIKVRITKNTLWLMSSRNSLLLHPGIMIRRSRNRFLKNSRFSSTFGLFDESPCPGVADPRARAAACRAAATFCSDMAERMRLRRAKKSVR